MTSECPKTVLLATDLSSRCDRAQDRSLQLARRWNARLVLVTVVEPETPARDSVFEDAELAPPGWAHECRRSPIAARPARVRTSNRSEGGRRGACGRYPRCG
ncbi:universal stress protein [Phenylobacterium sp. J367]|uniref:universal stress protein n=1 Tax=Phenylobacterium sp. J367 TaxID=2898435 RepID=UPI0035B487AB